MPNPNEKQDDIAVIEGQDGSATVDLPDNLLDRKSTRLNSSH